MSVSVTVRLPDSLAAKLEARCSIRKGSKTDVLVEAIERGWDEAPAMFGGDQPVGRTAAGASLSMPSMDDLRAICAGNVPKQPDPEPVEDATPRCCECDNHLTGKAIKGRGIVWACSNTGCAMYGREQRC